MLKRITSKITAIISTTQLKAFIILHMYFFYTHELLSHLSYITTFFTRLILQITVHFVQNWHY